MTQRTDGGTRRMMRRPADGRSPIPLAKAGISPTSLGRGLVTHFCGPRRRRTPPPWPCIVYTYCGPRRQTLSPPWPRILINCKGQGGQLLLPWPRTAIVSAVRPPPTPGQGGVILYRLGHAFSKDDEGVGEDALGDGLSLIHI